MTNKEDFTRKVQDYLRVLYEGRWVILFIVVIISGATWLYTSQQDDIYESKASVQIKRPQTILGNNQGFQDFGDQLGFQAERILANEIRILRSGNICDKVAQKLVAYLQHNPQRIKDLPILKANAQPSTLRKIARSLRIEKLFVQARLARMDTSSAFAGPELVSSRVYHQFTANPVRGLDFIEIVVASTSAFETAAMANFIVDAYRERNLESARQNITTARSFLEGQLSSKKDSLTHAENDVRSFQQSHGVVSLDNETRELINKLSSFEAQAEQAKIELEGAEKTVAEYRKQLATIDPALSKSLTDNVDFNLKQYLVDKANLVYTIDLMESNKQKNLKSRPDLESNFNEEINNKRTQLENITKKIDEMSKKFTNESDVTGTPVDYARDLRQKIKTKDIEIASLQAKLIGLNKTIADYNKKFEAIPNQSIDFARLERKRVSYDQLFSLLDQKTQEATINEQTTMGNIDIIDHASIPTRPVRPNRPLNILMGFLIAFGLGFAVSLIMRYLDTTIRSPDDVEKLGIPVLAFIPSFGSGVLSRNESLVALTAPQSPPSESYRTMRASIESAVNKNGDSMCVVITSPAPKEGKSTAISNLAVSAANSGRRVLLIDADMRRPVIHSIFDLEREPGLSNCLTGEVPVNKCIRKTMVPGLHVMPCGNIPSHPAELLGSAKMEKFVKIVRQYYDLILIDSPPIIAMADTLMLGKYTDGVALIVSANSTKTIGLQKAKELLESNHIRPLGVVVNRFNANKVYYSYYRYYYQNYYYYSESGEKKKKVVRKRKSEDVDTQTKDQ
jgi:capsular exopolysaccharide synthesis family protein